MMHSLIEFLYGLYKSLKTKEDLQLVPLTFIIESLIMAHGGNDEYHSNTSITINISEFLDIKEFIHTLIQNVSGRIKGGDSIVNEQMSLLISFFSRQVTAFLSETGAEFLISFATSANIKDPLLIRELRKLL
jgi:hypothetical protein